MGMGAASPTPIPIPIYIIFWGKWGNGDGGTPPHPHPHFNLGIKFIPIPPHFPIFPQKKIPKWGWGSGDLGPRGKMAIPIPIICQASSRDVPGSLQSGSGAGRH